MVEPVQLKDSVKDSADQTKAAAQHTAQAAERTKDSADRRTELAADRTVFAAERTYAAWVRTGLVALASGIGARKLLEGLVPGWMIVATGRPSSCSALSVSSPASGGSSSPEPRR
jgi:putative membrane protein